MLERAFKQRVAGSIPARLTESYQKVGNFGSTPGGYLLGFGRGLAVARLLYFSVTTLTTVGYGDVTPINPVASLLAKFEGMIGQLFAALTLDRLVTMQMSQRQQRDE